MCRGCPPPQGGERERGARFTSRGSFDKVSITCLGVVTCLAAVHRCLSESGEQALRPLLIFLVRGRDTEATVTVFRLGKIGISLLFFFSTCCYDEASCKDGGV